MRKLILTLCLIASPVLADTTVPTVPTTASMPEPLTASVSADDPIRPDPTLTPGDVLPVTADQVCQPGYASSVRHVSGQTKHQVYVEYGMTAHAACTVEIDPLISLELGGSNDIKNLWPQSYLTQPWNAHVKDKLENALHELVCSNQLPLSEAQQEISKDWIAAYEKYVGPQP